MLIAAAGVELAAAPVFQIVCIEVIEQRPHGLAS
jgi:hypothetical protein